MCTVQVHQVKCFERTTPTLTSFHRPLYFEKYVVVNNEGAYRQDTEVGILSCDNRDYFGTIKMQEAKNDFVVFHTIKCKK